MNRCNIFHNCDLWPFHRLGFGLEDGIDKFALILRKAPSVSLDVVIFVDSTAINFTPSEIQPEHACQSHPTLRRFYATRAGLNSAKYFIPQGLRGGVLAESAGLDDDLLDDDLLDDDLEVKHSVHRESAGTGITRIRGTG